MRYFILFGAAVMASGCALFEPGPQADELRKEFVDIAGDAVNAAAEGNWIKLGGAALSAITVAMYGTNKMRNRARQLRGEPTDVVPPKA